LTLLVTKTEIYTLLSLLFLTLFVIERVRPFQKLEQSRGWYLRFLCLFSFANLVGLLAEKSWIPVIRGWVFWRPLALLPAFFQGLLGFLLGSFCFYWWHRARHEQEWLWNIFHQTHHSPKRIEGLTAFYVHPLESVVSSILNSLIVFSLGASPTGYIWSIFFFALVGVFYHSNLQTPRWLSYLINTPELHRIHHLRGRHCNNYSDLPLWDMLFGTYQPVDWPEKPQKYGFRDDLEYAFGKILSFQNVLRKYQKH
jgi:sterol desaturase/sphingolipid hydroxylase (fatty acid hydroxylase superfamily)